MKSFRQQLEDELRDLWDSVPLTSEKLSNVAPNLVRVLSDIESAEDAIENLQRLLEAVTDRHDRALNAVLFANTDRNIAQRLNDYGLTISRDERSVRRWAGKGAQNVSDALYQAWPVPTSVSITLSNLSGLLDIRLDSALEHLDGDDRFEYANSHEPVWLRVALDGQTVFESPNLLLDPMPVECGSYMFDEDLLMLEVLWRRQVVIRVAENFSPDVQVHTEHMDRRLRMNILSPGSS